MLEAVLRRVRPIARDLGRSEVFFVADYAPNAEGSLSKTGPASANSLDGGARERLTRASLALVRWTSLSGVQLGGASSRICSAKATTGCRVDKARPLSTKSSSSSQVTATAHAYHVARGICGNSADCILITSATFVPQSCFLLHLLF